MKRTKIEKLVISLKLILDEETCGQCAHVSDLKVVFRQAQYSYDSMPKE